MACDLLMCQVCGTKSEVANPELNTWQELQAAGWYVDGDACFCPSCKPRHRSRKRQRRHRKSEGLDDRDS